MNQTHSSALVSKKKEKKKQIQGNDQSQQKHVLFTLTMFN